MKRKKEAGPVAFLFGFGLIVALVLVLWANENRFDYHKAAKSRTWVADCTSLKPGSSFAFTGSLPKELTLADTYLSDITGYLVVYRKAEIYCWDREKDSEGVVTWRKRWMSSVQDNSRNSDITQTLRSGSLLAKAYTLGELTIDQKDLHFVDKKQPIQPTDWPRTQEANHLVAEDRYLMHYPDSMDDLGSERLSWQGIPLAPKLTYFGNFSGTQAVADRTEQRDGFITSLIGDSGLLHHLVSGERNAALSTMKSHLAFRSRLTRGIGSAAMVLGFLLLLAPIRKLLSSIPLIGPLANAGIFVVALTLGLGLSAIVIVTGFFFSQPWLLALVLIGLIALLLIAFQRRRQQANLQKVVVAEQAQMGDGSNPSLSDQRAEQLQTFRKNSYASPMPSSPDRDSPNPEPTLKSLIRLALADQHIDRKEMQEIRAAAKDAGIKPKNFRRFMQEVLKAEGG